MARRQKVSNVTGLAVGDGPLKIGDQSGEWFVVAIEAQTIELQRTGWWLRLRNRIVSLWRRLRGW